MPDRSTKLAGALLTIFLTCPGRAAPGKGGDAAAESGAESILFQKLPAIETATLHTQTLEDSPADVTVITEHEIRRFGYRTLAEVLSNVRGFYTSSDGAWQHVGVRGFGLPGDYESRLLVMVNGHSMTDNVYGAMYMFGRDFGIDLDLVQRIEVVRGPMSALYGSSGIFATVNIFTRAPADSARIQFAAGGGSSGERSANLSTSIDFGRGINLLLAGSGYTSNGYELEAVPNGDFSGGRVAGVSAERQFSAFAQFSLLAWSVTAKFSDGRVRAPIGIFGTRFADPETSSTDLHNFIDAVWSRNIGKSSNLRWRVYYDQFRYFGRFPFDLRDGGINHERDDAFGDWVGSQLIFSTPLKRIGRLTVGVQGNGDLRNLQRTYSAPDVEHPYRYETERDISYGLFAQQEIALTRKLSLLAGGRWDNSRVHHSFVSPRGALVYQFSNRTTYKFGYGRAFRNPSNYERLWSPSPNLSVERANTWELSAQRRVGRAMSILASSFHYRLNGLIEGVPISPNVLQYRNQSNSRATGLELEVQGKPSDRIEMSGSVTTQRVRYANPSRRLANSPQRLAQFRASLPLLKQRLALSSSVRHFGARQTLFGMVLPAATLVDVTVITQRLHPHFDVQSGVRNLGDVKYSDPLSDEHLPAVLRRPGRSFFVRLIWRHGD